jgi:hypothetical protein
LQERANRLMDNHLDNELELLEQRQIEQKARRLKNTIPIQSTPVPSLISQTLTTQTVENNNRVSNNDKTEVEENDTLFLFETDANEINNTVPRYDNYEGIGYSNINFQINSNTANNILPMKKSIEIVRRQSPRKYNISSSSTNAFAGLHYEIVNELLHSKYPLASKGVLSLTDFNLEGARKDLYSLLLLKIGDIIDDPNLTMIGLWVKKLQVAIKSGEDDDSGSDLFN